jgi:hypothetical protein
MSWMMWIGSFSDGVARVRAATTGGINASIKRTITL